VRTEGFEPSHKLLYQSSGLTRLAHIRLFIYVPPLGIAPKPLVFQTNMHLLTPKCLKLYNLRNAYQILVLYFCISYFSCILRIHKYIFLIYQNKYMSKHVWIKNHSLHFLSFLTKTMQPKKSLCTAQ
jgi:hypothetical protein